MMTFEKKKRFFAVRLGTNVLAGTSKNSNRQVKRLQLESKAGAFCQEDETAKAPYQISTGLGAKSNRSNCDEFS